MDERVSLKLHFDIAATESVQNILYLSEKRHALEMIGDNYQNNKKTFCNILDMLRLLK